MFGVAAPIPSRKAALRRAAISAALRLAGRLVQSLVGTPDAAQEQHQGPCRCAETRQDQAQGGDRLQPLPAELSGVAGGLAPLGGQHRFDRETRGPRVGLARALASPAIFSVSARARARHPGGLDRIVAGHQRQGCALCPHRADVGGEGCGVAAVEVGARQGQRHPIGGVDRPERRLGRFQHPVAVAPGPRPRHGAGHKQHRGQDQQQLRGQPAPSVGVVHADPPRQSARGRRLCKRPTRPRPARPRPRNRTPPRLNGRRSPTI